jgi:hypothetical protein
MHRSKWELDIIMDLKGTGWEGLDLIHLAEERDK